MPQAQPNVDCSRVQELITEINQTQREIATILRDMEDLGFGTARTLRLIKAIYKFADVLDKIPAVVWEVLYKFVRCDDAALAQLAVNELKLLVEVLAAHAEVELEAIEDANQRAEVAAWLQRLRLELDNWANDRAKDDAITAIKALKQYLVKAAPRILRALVDAFADDVLEAIKNGLVPSKKSLIKNITKRILIFVLGKAAAQRVNPFVGVALTGWELLVELAGGGAIEDLRAYIDRLLLELVILLQQCGRQWPQTGVGFFLRGNSYLGATITARPFVRCARMVDGKPQWSTPCPLRFSNAGRPARAFITVTPTKENMKPNGRWDFEAPIDPASVQNAPCLKDAKHCYTYIELTIVFPNGTKSVMALIVGARSF